MAEQHLNNNTIVLTADGTYTKHIPLDAAVFHGNPAGNPPTQVFTDNRSAQSYTINNDEAWIKWYKPIDFVSTSDLIVEAHYTNDGDEGDNGKDVKMQVDYQCVDLGGATLGSHGNSPRSAEESYVGAAGSEDNTVEVTIPNADISSCHYVLMKISFPTPAGAPLLGGEVIVIWFDIEYTAKQAAT